MSISFLEKMACCTAPIMRFILFFSSSKQGKWLTVQFLKQTLLQKIFK